MCEGNKSASCPAEFCSEEAAESYGCEPLCEQCSEALCHFGTCPYCHGCEGCPSGHPAACECEWLRQRRAELRYGWGFWRQPLTESLCPN